MTDIDPDKLRDLPGWEKLAPIPLCMGGDYRALTFCCKPGYSLTFAFKCRRAEKLSDLGLNPEEFIKDGKDYHTANDLESQANYLGVTIEADIIKQKLSTTNRGFLDLNFGRTDKLVYEKLATDHPIEWNRYQIANCYMGRVGLINSGGPSGDNDL